MNRVFFPTANAQIENCYNLESNNSLPVLLIHGWNEGTGGVISLHWYEWTQSLSEENILFCIISFEQSNDTCKVLL
jgi:hypothetical protein